jgi:hypothetical protein
MSLKTAWFGKGCYHWRMSLEDEQGYSLDDIGGINPLGEPFSSYTPERLKQWKNEALEMHRLAVETLEDLYWRGETLPKNFLQEI